MLARGTNIVLEDGGRIQGTVVDKGGAGLQRARLIITTPDGAEFPVADIRETDANGAFVSDLLPFGGYRVALDRGETKSVNVDSAAGTRVQFVIDGSIGSITGVVRDAAGLPVADAYVVASPQEGTGPEAAAATRWDREYGAVLSGSDGRFTIPGLAPGNYTVRAFRSGGGGEAFEPSVPSGGSVALTFRPTATLAGAVRSRDPRTREVYVNAVDAKTLLQRGDRFLVPDGRYRIDDLPPGDYTVTAYAHSRRGQTVVRLREGEAKADADIDLDSCMAVRGRIVDVQTRQPISGFSVVSPLENEGAPPLSLAAIWGSALTGSDGRFAIECVPAGRRRLAVMSVPGDDYGQVDIVLDVATEGTIELGDIGAVKTRLSHDATAGTLGVTWTKYGEGTLTKDRALRVATVEPAGPAAAALRPGDTVVSIDGIDVTGYAHSLAWTLLEVAPGTTLRLRLARGATVAVVASAP